jgi:hypothetical protein
MKENKKYVENARYEKVYEQMQLLGIEDVTTNRQHRNDTVVWRLPIKINYPGNKERFIEVASFSTGYVRNQNSGYTNYQLNKRCEGEPEYFKLSNGDYRKFTTRSCVLIPKEIDRLEYLLKYCVKNYYIKNANQVPNGDFISKWQYQSYKDEYEKRANEVNDLQNKLEKVKTQCNNAYDCGLSDGKAKANETYSENTGAMARIGELEDRVYELESQVKVADAKRHELHDLQNKLATIKRVATI